jgi:SAM-dependent methyltransferase
MASIADGVADFVGDGRGLAPGSDRYSGVTVPHGVLAFDLPARIKRAAGSRWPDKLGEVIEFGCGLGHMTEAVATGETIRGLLVLDTDKDLLQACQERLRGAGIGLASGPPVFFAAVGGAQNAVRDAVADTVIGTTAMATASDVRSFLTRVHRILKPGGRALFVIPNRRYWQAICLAMAEALVQRHARDGAWPDGAWPVMTKLAEKWRQIVHNGTSADRDGTHLFDADAVEHLGDEMGFATADVIPLHPDAAGADTVGRVCREAGAPDGFARDAGFLAAVAGRRFFGLLSDRDASAFNIVWLTKAPGPTVRFQKARPPETTMVYPDPELALGGASPHWSIELLGREAPGGIVVKVGGWCLSNVDVLAVRITLDGVERYAQVWRYRPDVHEIMNRQRLFHPVNALFSGLGSEVLFAGLRAGDHGCRLQIDVVLAGGISLSGPAPDRLVLDEPMVIGH